jgi:hypothetical protein
MYIFLIFILKLSLRPRRLIHPARGTHKGVAGPVQVVFRYASRVFLGGMGA